MNCNEAFHTWRRRRLLRSVGLTLAGAGLLWLAAALVFPEALRSYMQSLAWAKLAVLLGLTGLYAGALLLASNRCRPDCVPLEKLFLRVHWSDYLAAALQILLWLLLGHLLQVLQERPPTRFQTYMGILLMGMGGVGLGLFQVGFLRPLSIDYWRALAEGKSISVAEAGPFWTLQNRLSLVLGGLVFFACGISLAVSFTQQKTMVRFYAQRETSAILEHLRQQTPSPDGQLPCKALRDLAPEGGLLTLCAHPSGPCCSGSRESQDFPSADANLLAARSGDVLRLEGFELEGVATVLGPWTLAAFMPTPLWAERGLAVTLAIYTIMFLLSALIAAQAGREFSLPLRNLAGQVRRLGSGQFDQPVLPLTPDEFGHLAEDMESTRQRLASYIGEITELNATLETRVQDRTTELQDANQRLSDAMARLKETQAGLIQTEKMAALGTLVAGVAHEINNPLNAVVNNLAPLAERIEELKSGSPHPDTVRELTEIIGVMSEASSRALQIVSDLKTFARKDEARLKDASVDEGILSTVRLLEHRFRQQNVALDQSLHAGPPIPCHPGPLNQLVMNLLTNALDALPQGGRIRLATTRDADAVTLEIQDNGPGIPLDIQARVFDPFFTQKPGGTGLGLAIAASAARVHGGQIHLESSPGQGALFRVRIPIPPA
jgi:signal transduction histidine kinase